MVTASPVWRRSWRRYQPTARRSAGALAPYASGVYVNALSDDGADGVTRAYPPAVLARLVTELPQRLGKPGAVPSFEISRRHQMALPVITFDVDGTSVVTTLGGTDITATVGG